MIKALARKYLQLLYLELIYTHSKSILEDLKTRNVRSKKAMLMACSLLFILKIMIEDFSFIYEGHTTRSFCCLLKS